MLRRARRLKLELKDVVNPRAKRKLQHGLQAHLRMQHQLLSQLNQVVLPAVEQPHTEGGEEGENGDGENGGEAQRGRWRNGEN